MLTNVEFHTKLQRLHNFNSGQPSERDAGSNVILTDANALPYIFDAMEEVYLAFFQNNQINDKNDVLERIYEEEAITYSKESSEHTELRRFDAMLSVAEIFQIQFIAKTGTFIKG